jgi:hypothetical protein
MSNDNVAWPLRGIHLTLARGSVVSAVVTGIGTRREKQRLRGRRTWEIAGKSVTASSGVPQPPCPRRCRARCRSDKCRIPEPGER